MSLALLFRVSVSVTLLFLIVNECNAQCGEDIKISAVKAKQEGHNKIFVSSPIPEYAVVSSLQEAAQYAAILVVEVQDKNTKLSPDGSCLTSWYRATVLQNIGRLPLPAVTNDPEPSVPSELSTEFLKDDILVRIAGGTITIDGVTVSSPERPEALTIGRRYLLFVSFQESATPHARSRVAELEIGKQGIYNYDPETDGLESLDRTAKATPFTTDVLTRSAATLTSLKSYLAQLTHK